jgi:hypothetical protein
LRITLRREIPHGCAFIYLSPTLEKEYCINATWAVAHEFAHAVLGHGNHRLRNVQEIAADEKAASDLADMWVPKNNPENSRCGMLLNKGEEALKLELERMQGSDL